MKTTQHTPGKWIAIYSTMHERTVIGTWNEKSDFPKAVIAIMNTATHELDDQVSEEDKANARLIAAAPELLEACKLALAYVLASGIDRSNYDDIAKIRAAIAKAEGKEQP